jgi:hypothetical protein
MPGKIPRDHSKLVRQSLLNQFGQSAGVIQKAIVGNKGWFGFSGRRPSITCSTLKLDVPGDFKGSVY